jgi:PhnB protein
MANQAQTRTPTVVPMLSYERGAAAIDWLTRAFGFEEEADSRIVTSDGTVTHAELRTGDGLIMLATPTPDYHAPARHRAECEAANRWLRVPWVIDGVLVHVDDVDAHRERAISAGARMLSDIEDAGFGRLYRAEDVEGHRWMFVQPA